MCLSTFLTWSFSFLFYNLLFFFLCKSFFLFRCFACIFFKIHSVFPIISGPMSAKFLDFLFMCVIIRGCDFVFSRSHVPWQRCPCIVFWRLHGNYALQWPYSYGLIITFSKIPWSSWVQTNFSISFPWQCFYSWCRARSCARGCVFKVPRSTHASHLLVRKCHLLRPYSFLSALRAIHILLPPALSRE